MNRVEQATEPGPRPGARAAAPAVRADLPTAEEGRSMEWLYWLTAVWSGTLMLLPYTPAKFLLYSVFWIVFGWVVLNVPRYVPLMVILGLPAMVFAPASSRTGIPLVNNHTFFLVGLLIAVYLVHKRSEEPVPPNPLKGPPIYLALLLSFSAVVSYLTGAAMWHTWEQGWYHVSFFSLITMVKGIVLFPFFAPLAFQLLSTREHVRRTVHVIAISTLLVSLEDIWELRHAIVTGSVGAYNRASGFAGEPNGFGGYLALMITILFPLFLYAKLNSRERFLFLAAMGAAATALLFTLSRGSWLALIAALCYLALVRGFKAMAFVMVLALTATIWLPQSVIDRAKDTLRVDPNQAMLPFVEEEVVLDGSAGGRIKHWEALVDQWAAAPIFGHGFASYGKLYGHVRKKTGAPVAAHSTIVELTAEEGLLGFIAYVALIWVLTLGARGLLKLGPERDPDGFFHPLASGLLAATLCLIILDGSGSRMKSPLVMTNLWILAGGLARLHWNEKQVLVAAEIEEMRRKTRRRRSRPRLPGEPARRPV